MLKLFFMQIKRIAAKPQKDPFSQEYLHKRAEEEI